MSELPRSEESRPRGLGAAARVTALAGSVMDLHVRIALQEVSREKRRLIGGGVLRLPGRMGSVQTPRMRVLSGGWCF